jgi:hypothetical protein
MLARILLLGPLMPFTCAQAKSASDVPVLLSSYQTSEALWSGDFLGSIPFYGAILLLGSSLGSALLLGGITAIERWRDRRREGN